MIIGVIGSGTMGSGIAQSFASNDFKVLLHDISDDMLSKAFNTINKSLDRMINKGITTKEEANSSLANITTSTSVDMMSNCDLIIEAATENIDIKKKIFKKLDNLSKSNCILASNTSSISINELADSTNRPSMVIGMHFMNPVPIMKLVEIIKGDKTDKLIVKKSLDYVKSINKIPVECNDSPGFVSNRILMPMINEAAFTYMEDVATVEAIDNIMKLGMGHPMGPLKLADLIGIDVCVSIMEVLYKGFKNKKYKVCPILEKMVEDNKLGMKSGEGFYKY